MRFSLILVAIILWHFPAYAACTDDVDCFCDLNPVGVGGVIFCEDFDDPAYDDGTGTGWGLVHTAPDGFLCPGGVEGTNASDCFNIVDNGSCDVTGETDCVIEEQSLGAKYDEGYTHGFFATNSSWSGGDVQTFGITSAVKFSSNFVRGGASGFKHEEFSGAAGVSRQALHLGQDGYVHPNDWDQFVTAGGTGYLGTTGKDLTYGLKIFFEKDIQAPFRVPDISGATATIGAVAHDDGGDTALRLAAYDSDFPGSDGTMTLGEWHCFRTKWTGFGTASARVEQWYQGADEQSETKVIDVSGIDMTDMEHSKNIGATDFGDYFNGYQGAGCAGQNESVSCGYGSTSCSGSCSYAGLDRAYRYVDNLVATNTDPVSCATVLGASASTPPSITGSILTGGVSINAP